MIRKFLLAAALALGVSPALAQNHTCPTRANGDSTNACASTKFVQNAVTGGGTLSLPSANIFVGNGSNVATAVPLTKDCDMSNTGQITCLNTNGVPFGTMATQNVGASGDLSGSWPSPTVAKVQGLPWQATSYSNGQVPVWNTSNGRFQPGSTPLPSGSDQDVLHNSGGGTTYVASALTTLLSSVCSNATLRPGCVSFFGYADPRWWGAVCGASSAAAINSAITYMAGLSGGKVLITCGYLVASTITVQQGVSLEGTSRVSSQISSNGADLLVILIDGTFTSPELKHLWIIGNTTDGATQPLIAITANTPAVIEDVNAWGGLWALEADGTDARINNSYFYSFGAGGTPLRSVGGANWFVNDKFDNATGSPAYGAYLSALPGATAIMENHFVNCDFSGPWTVTAMRIDDSAAAQRVAVTFVSSSVFSAGISTGAMLVNSAKFTSLSAMEIGGNITKSADPLSIGGGSYGFTGITATGASCSTSNVGITC